MNHRLACLLLLAATIFAAAPAEAQRIHQAQSPTLMAPPAAGPMAVPAHPALGARIIAVVNDNIISSSDLTARVQMAIVASGLPDTPEVREHLVAQILRVMIDEQLELQEAKKQDITVSQDDIDKTMARIAEDNHIPGGDMKTFLQTRGISPDTLSQQIRASTAWTKVIQRELRPRVDIGDDEIDAVIERMRTNAGKDEFLTSEIFLSVDNPKDETQVQQFAGNLAQQIRQQSTSFGAIARQFSQSSSAGAGGDIGWVQDGELAPELNRTLEALKPGQVTDPVRAASGYYILGLRDKRTITLGDNAGPATVQLQQVTRPFAGADKAVLLKEADRLRMEIVSCDDLKNKLPAQFPAWHLQDLGDVNLSSAPSWLAERVRSLSIGKSSDAMATGGNAMIVFVCGRSGGGEGKVDRDAILAQIGNEKLELQARGLLRDLRRDAYLDVRLSAPNG